MSTIKLYCVTALYGAFLKTNKHQILTRLGLLVDTSYGDENLANYQGLDGTLGQGCEETLGEPGFSI